MGDVLMSEKEVERYEILRRVARKELKIKDTAQLMGVGERQAKRLYKAFKEHGKKGLVSKARGKRSNRAFSKEHEEKILDLVASHYHDFGPTLAAEKLDERHNIKVSNEKLRQMMIIHGLWKPKAIRKAVAYQRRPRRKQRGELVQMDASPHDWFESRGPNCALHLAIDDATSEVLAGRFEPTETTVAYLRMFKGYVQEHGLPKQLYGDRSTIFYVSHGEKRKTTQFTRAMKELGVKVTCANSAQAKGRVERKNGVLQDRLVKELRLQGISTIDEANEFLPIFFAEFNRKFAKPAYNTHDAHTPLKHNLNLEIAFAIKATRKITKNLEVQFENRILQIQAPNRVRRLRYQAVTVIKTLKGQLHIDYKGELLRFVEYGVEETQPPIKNHKEIAA